MPKLVASLRMTRRGVRAWPALLLLVLGAVGGCARSAPADASLVLERTIALQAVAGRIDHLAFDPKRGRLFIAELGNGSVEAVDLASGRSAGRITGLKEPQGLAFLPDRDELAVASGGDGAVRFYRGGDLAAAGWLSVGGDADNLRVDAASGRLVVGTGDGALVTIDPAVRKIVAATPLPAHPEGFQLDGSRAYVNLPDAGEVAVVDLAAGRILARWPNPGLKWNFPLAIDPADHAVAVVYRFPARLVLWRAASGQVLETLKVCGDADDLFFDAPRRRLYVVCGQGAVDVFTATAAGYARTERVQTRPGARTGLFVPALDRLFVAARTGNGQDAAVLVFRPRP